MRPKQKSDPLQEVGLERSEASPVMATELGDKKNRGHQKHMSKHEGMVRGEGLAGLSTGHPGLVGHRNMSSSSRNTMILRRESREELLSGSLISVDLQIPGLPTWDSSGAHAWDRDQSANDKWCLLLHLPPEDATKAGEAPSCLSEERLLIYNWVCISGLLAVWLHTLNLSELPKINYGAWEAEF